MMRAIVVFSAALILTAGSSFARSPQPYAGLQTRPLKALSGEDLADLREGRGMGLALAGELNGYPGPKHVLELARELNLTEAQRARTQELFDAMKAEAVPLGSNSSRRNPISTGNFPAAPSRPRPWLPRRRQSGRRRERCAPRI